MIRSVRTGDLPALRRIERAAGGAFRDIGMDRIADDEPPSSATLSGYAADGRAWVAVDDDDDDDLPVGYLLLDLVDANAHVEQVSVHPSWSRRGLGRELLETAAAHAVALARPALTLTTFEHVPWNGPYYARLGFRVLSPDELGPGLRAVREHERTAGLDAWPRVAMLRALG